MHGSASVSLELSWKSKQSTHDAKEERLEIETTPREPRLSMRTLRPEE